MPLVHKQYQLDSFLTTGKYYFKDLFPFYDNMRKGRRADAALRKAKLEFLDNALPGDQHPRYWAGYILMGKPEFYLLPAGPLRLSGIGIAMVLMILIGRNLLKKYRTSRS